MGAEVLSSRAIIGRFYRTLEQDMGMGWVNAVSMYFNSDQDLETYPWIGQVPQMREWVGGRHAKGFLDNSIEIRNKHYEATIELLVKDMRRDKSGQIMTRIDELAQRTNAHWASLLSTLILNGPSTVCYDGQYFFDTDHSEGDSGTQSNDITVDISALPAPVAGSTTAPSVSEFQQSVLKGVQQIQSFVDDRGEPMNENAMSFLVMVPTSLHYVATNALSVPRESDLEARGFGGISISVAANARLSSWTDKFAVFRTDSATKAFIRQEEQPVDLKAKAEGSEFEFDNDAHQYGVDTWRNVGYGFWQDACLVTLA